MAPRGGQRPEFPPDRNASAPQAMDKRDVRGAQAMLRARRMLYPSCAEEEESTPRDFKANEEMYECRTDENLEDDVEVRCRPFPHSFE